MVFLKNASAEEKEQGPNLPSTAQKISMGSIGGSGRRGRK